MSSTIGNTLRLTLFGRSHGPVIGMTLAGIPAGKALSPAALQAFLDRRAPGRSPLSTARREADVPRFLSGLNGRRYHRRGHHRRHRKYRRPLRRL